MKGCNSIGFDYVVKSVFGNTFTDGKSWSKFSQETRDKIDDLLGKHFYMFLDISIQICNHF